MDLEEQAHLNEVDEDESDDLEEDEYDPDEDDSSQDYDANQPNLGGGGGADIIATTVSVTNKKTKKPAAPVAPSSTSSHQQAPTDSNAASSSSSGGSFFYEAKCAFSHYWLDFTFESAGTNSDSATAATTTTTAADFTQFWNLYYPCMVCKPLLAMINCRMFYVKFEGLRKFVLWTKRLKARLVPVHEFETGHGFKLFSS